MTIYDELRTLYSRSGRRLEDDLAYYINSGYVFSGPDYFLMGERCEDGWYIQVAIGRGLLDKFGELMPYYLPWIGWRRERKYDMQVVWFPTERLLRKVNYARNSKSA